jgi:glycosyltransferase involved in cell wall biosynthesis
VVFDQVAVAESLAVDDPRRPVRVMANDHTPGLAGGRNTGIGRSTGELVAFCDDDDEWLPGKLEQQVVALDRSGADVAVCGIRIDYGDRVSVRVPHDDELTLDRLSAERVTAAHPSTVIVRRAALDVIGTVDEEIPGSYGEDYDWLLRAAAHGTITAVSEPLVRVLWHRGSYFAGRWQTIFDALQYLVDKHPEIRSSRMGLARVRGQQAFALAALGKRRHAFVTIRETLRLNIRERRAYLAALVACRLLKAQTVVHMANARGRGI